MIRSGLGAVLGIAGIAQILVAASILLVRETAPRVLASRKSLPRKSGARVRCRIVKDASAEDASDEERNA